MRSLMLVTLGTAAVLSQECASQCGSWHFPPNQIDLRFELYPLRLPNAFTIEAWVKRSGPAVANRWMFSLATPATDNCILLSSAALPDSGWHHIMVTSASKTFLDGVDASTPGFAAPGLQNRNGGAACAVAGASFVINIDQDAAAPPHALDPIQASDLLVNSVAIFDMAYNQQQASDRWGKGCYVTPTDSNTSHIVAAWWGMDNALHPADRTFPSTPPGPLVCPNCATLPLPLSGIERIIDHRGPRCPLPPPSPPSPPSPPPPPPPPPSPPRPLGYCKSECTSWRFPRAQTSYRFQIFPIELPAAYTIEGWVRHVGDPRTTAQNTYFFSFATPANDNCILLNAIGLQDSAWHHVAVTSEGYVFLNGERTDALGNNHRGTACAGKPNSAFVLNIDQDAPAHSLDPEQAANLVSNGIAIWDRALTEAQAYERYARGCFGALDGAWGAWYAGEDEGEDDEDFQETTAAGYDRTGHGRDAQVYLPWPGGLPKEGPSCVNGPPERPPDDGDDEVSVFIEKDGSVGGAYTLGVFALLFALAGLVLAVYNGGYLERFGVGPDVRHRVRPSIRSSSMTAVSMGMPLAVNDSAAGSYNAASVPPAASVTPLGATKC